MKIPLCKPTLTEEMKKVALEVLESGRYIKGPRIKDFEKNFSDYCNVKHGIAVSNGTTALYVALRSLELQKGDEVILPSHTFVSTGSMIVLAGGKPVFVDVDDSYNMDMEDLEKRVTEKTKAVIPVHLYGQMCDMNRLQELKDKYGFSIIEDAAQAHGAEYKKKKSGGFGDINCFSFFPSKNITVCGDGGMIVTNNDELEIKSRMIRDHGRDYRDKEGKYFHRMLGFNFRLSEILGAIGNVQLQNLDEWVKERRKLASIYDDLLTDNLIKPEELENRKHVYYVYVIRTEKRDELMEFLKKHEIETGIHYPVPLHQQPIFKPNDYNLPKTELLSKQILSLPMFPTLKEEEVKYVCEKINKFLN
jgi:dTDP-4-amino-4,6-dideoxygalactose transaminase